MSNATTEALPWWARLLQNVPGFIYGFIVGVISGYFANWAWERFKPRRKEPHLSVEIGEYGTHFSGMFPPDQQKGYLKVLEASAKTTSKKEIEGTRYVPPSEGESTKQ